MAERLSTSEQLMVEWDYERNIGINPEKLTLRSNKTVWWKCARGHNWRMSIDKRFANHQSCPYCNNKRVLRGYNDLITLYPRIAGEWMIKKNHPLKVTDVVKGSARRVWWKCSVCGNEWIASVRSRTQRGTDCPKCAPFKGAERHIETIIKKSGSVVGAPCAIEWNYERNLRRPEQYARTSNKAVWWKCKVCSYEWMATICSRVNGSGCPACAGKVVICGKTDIATTDPLLAKEWHPTKNGKLTPQQISRGSGKLVWWQCPIGHTYKMTPNARTSRGVYRGCPICSSGSQTSFPEQAIFYYIKEAFPDAINRYKAEFLKKMELDVFIPSLKLGIEYDGEVWHNDKHRDREIRKCKLCHDAGIKLWRVKEKLDDNSKWRPFEDVPCDMALHMDNLYEPKTLNRFIPNLMRQIRSSYFIQTKRVSVDVERDRAEICKFLTPLISGSIAETMPELAKEWHPTKNGNQKPSMFTRGSDYKAWWVCPLCGHEYKALIGHRANGTACPKCKTIRFAETYRRHHVQKHGAISDPMLLMEWDTIRNEGKTPDMFSPGSDYKAWWCCSTCGYAWRARIANRSHGRGCPRCAGKIR